MTPRRPVVAGTLALFGLLMGTEAARPVRTHAPLAGPPLQTEAVSAVIPLHDDEGWQLLRYDNIPPHAVDFSPLGLRIQVENSAAPFVYPLSAPMAVSRLTVRGRVDGALRLAWQRQGSEGFDDYVFKAGLVLTGSRRLGTFRRMFAPEWVRRDDLAMLVESRSCASSPLVRPERADRTAPASTKRPFRGKRSWQYHRGAGRRSILDVSLTTPRRCRRVGCLPMAATQDPAFTDARLAASRSRQRSGRRPARGVIESKGCPAG